MAINNHKIPNMSYNEQQAEIDQYTQMDFGGSWMTNYAGVLETHLPSDYSNCLMGMNQREILTQLPQEVHPQYAQSVYESFSIHDASLEGLNLVTELVDQGTRPPDVLTFGESVFHDYPGYPQPDNHVPRNKTANTEGPVDKGAVGFLQETRPMLTKVIERRKPHSDAFKQQLRDSALRSNQWAKAYTLKLVMEAEFQDSDGNLVDHLVMPATRDIAAFLGCSNTTVRLALRKTDDKKGVVLGVWKVEECERTNSAEVEASRALHGESSLCEQEIDMEPMSLLLSFINSPSCQSVAHWETSNKPGSSMTHALSQTNLPDTVSVGQTSQSLLSLEDVARNNKATLMQSLNNAMNHHNNHVDVTCVDLSHDTQT